MLHFPVFRLGFVIASDREIDSDTADRIAEVVLAEEHVFLQAILECVDKYELAERVPGTYKGETHARRTPAIVVDFPPVAAVVGGRKVQIRSCVTICIDHKQSKCWSRITMNDKAVTEDESDALFDSFERLCRTVNERTLKIYSDIIKRVIPEPIKLDKYYEINVRTASQKEEWIEEYFQAVFSGEELGSNIDSLKEKLDRVLIKMNSDLKYIPKALQTIKRNNKKVRQIGLTGNRIPFRSTAPFSSHRIHAVYVLEYGGSKASFTGIGYDPYLDKVSFQESLSHVASANLAVEYGALF